MSWQTIQSVHNINTQKYLNMKNPSYIDWEITAVFYSALHLIDAYLLKNHGARPHKHKDRFEKISLFLQPIYNEYDNLYTLSLRSRYLVKHDHLKEPEKVENIEPTIVDSKENNIQPQQ